MVYNFPDSFAVGGKFARTQDDRIDNKVVQWICPVQIHCNDRDTERTQQSRLHYELGSEPLRSCRRSRRVTLFCRIVNNLTTDYLLNPILLSRHSGFPLRTYYPIMSVLAFSTQEWLAYVLHEVVSYHVSPATTLVSLGAFLYACGGLLSHAAKIFAISVAVLLFSAVCHTFPLAHHHQKLSFLIKTKGHYALLGQWTRLGWQSFKLKWLNVDRLCEWGRVFKQINLF